MTTPRDPVNPAAASTTIRFFLSSTFADFQTERTSLAHSMLNTCVQ